MKARRFLTSRGRRSRDPIATTENVQVLPGDTFDGVRQEKAVVTLFVPGGGPRVGEVIKTPPRSITSAMRAARLTTPAVLLDGSCWSGR
jgi:hypothetical protein